MYRYFLSNHSTFLWCCSVVIYFFTVGQWKIAEGKYEESLCIKKEVLPEGNAEIALTLDLLAMARIEQSDYAGAIAPVEEALEVRRKAKGRDDLSVVNQLHSLAFLCRISGDTAKLAEVNKEIGIKVPVEDPAEFPAM